VTSAGNSQSTVVGTAYPTALAVQVADGYQNPIQAGGINVTFTIVPTGTVSGSFAGGKSKVTVPTSSLGIATASKLTANTHAGSFTVTATAAGLTRAVFALTSTAAGAGKITLMKVPDVKVSPGKRQTAGPASDLPTALQAVVRDRFGNVVGGVAVTFTVTPNTVTGALATFGGELSATATTDGQGLAVAPALKTNARRGRLIVTATIAGLAEKAIIKVTASELAALSSP
jgi:hypothetical protein